MQGGFDGRIKQTEFGTALEQPVPRNIREDLPLSGASPSHANPFLQYLGVISSILLPSKKKEEVLMVAARLRNQNHRRIGKVASFKIIKIILNEFRK